MVASRIKEMNPSNSNNLNYAIKIFESLGKYSLYPSKMADNGGLIEPIWDKSILKKKLIIRNAWEIGEHDLDGIAIYENDQPILPENITDIPVLRLLKRKKIDK